MSVEHVIEVSMKDDGSTWIRLESVVELLAVLAGLTAEMTDAADSHGVVNAALGMIVEIADEADGR